MSKVTAEQAQAWEDIVSRKYADQAIWFLNGFWEEVKGDAENFWMYAELFAELDEAKKADGNELDEFWSHKFLERIGKTMTVIKMREEFRTIDVDFNKKMSMTEFLGYTYHKTIQQIIDAPQGGNQELINAAQAQVEEAQNAVEEMVAKLEVATQKANEAKAAAEAAAKAAEAAAVAEANANKAAKESAVAAEAAKKAAEAAAKAAEAAKQAEEENKAALAELQAQEKAFADKKAALEKTKNDMSIGIVKRNKASNELDQLLAEDPLPLQRAKINQGATVRKMEKAAKAAEEAKVKADQQAAAAEKAAKAAAEAAEAARMERENADRKKAEADDTAAAAEAAKAEAEAAVSEAEAKLQKAMEALEAAKKAGGVAHGAIWWMERQIEEKKKYMPGYKGPRK